MRRACTARRVPSSARNLISRLQLREKQKARRIYGVQERQFRRYFRNALHVKGMTGVTLLLTLERRLDNVVFRMGLADSRPQARQLVRHGHFKLNGHNHNVPSYLVEVGDVDRGAPDQPQQRLLQGRGRPAGRARVCRQWLRVRRDPDGRPYRRHAGSPVRRSAVERAVDRRVLQPLTSMSDCGWRIGPMAGRPTSNPRYLSNTVAYAIGDPPVGKGGTLLNFVLPKIEREASARNYGRFVIGPMERAIGITLGNALRRVLLSSLPGAAVSSIRISGVHHEFSPIPYVREDTTALLLNIKQIRLEVRRGRAGAPARRCAQRRPGDRRRPDLPARG